MKHPYRDHPFTAALRQLFTDKGHPPYGVIVDRAGGVLSRAAVSKALTGAVRPTWVTAAAIIRGLGADPAKYVKLYQDAHPTGVVRTAVYSRDVPPSEEVKLLTALLAAVTGLRADLRIVHADKFEGPTG